MTSATDNRTTELLPCPFCGGVARHYAPGPIEHHIECMNPKCYAVTHGWPTEADAIAAWNARYHCGLTDEDYNILLDELGVTERTCKREKHGRKMNGSWRMRCSECGYGIGDMRWSHCPNCGARIEVDA